MPFFVFGTGRCGSTHLQRLISLRTKTWIWGEHDGFLTPAMKSLNVFEKSNGLKASFKYASESDDQLIAHMQTGSWRLAWLNRFDSSKLRRELQSTIERLFLEPLPEGWTDWGFKEILYGLDNDVPAQLLSLFPASKAVFTFRSPRQTIESMLRTWSPALVRDCSKKSELEAVFDERATRWRKLMIYFLRLKERECSRITFLTPQAFQQDGGELVRALGFTNIIDDQRWELSLTNVGSGSMQAWARDLFESKYSRLAEELEELHSRAEAVYRSEMSVGVLPV